MMRRGEIVYGVVLLLEDCGRRLSTGMSVSSFVHSWHGSLNEVKIGRLSFWMDGHRLLFVEVYFRG